MEKGNRRLVSLSTKQTSNQIERAIHRRWWSAWYEYEICKSKPSKQKKTLNNAQHNSNYKLSKLKSHTPSTFKQTSRAAACVCVCMRGNRKNDGSERETTWTFCSPKIAINYLCDIFHFPLCGANDIHGLIKYSSAASGPDRHCLANHPRLQSWAHIRWRAHLIIHYHRTR